MEPQTNESFKAVDFMRQVREDLSHLYSTDKQRYLEEIQKAMADFKTAREQARTANLALPEAEA